jgi:AraC family transcriptional regulator of adaptative response/methylated-DNA-[protein]-cysteine methyltransferase
MRDRWEAVIARDTCCDGQFVYGVRSTGIYCRPSCPSRKPRRETVLFFDAAKQAEDAGFRPCLRCLPERAADASTTLAERARALLDANPDRRLTLAELARPLGISPGHLQRLFRRVLGVSPARYSAAARARRFKQLVRKNHSVTDAIYDAGYGASSRAYEAAGSSLGMTPGTYRKGGSGMRIHYAVRLCPLGYVLVGATGRGICAVRLGDAPEELASGLRFEFPKAQISEDDGPVQAAIDAVLAYLAGAGPSPVLPLDVQATAFQARVWQELRRIPPGATRSYSEIAAALGQPSAARAVARACATNPAALVIPCHRVVHACGDPTGYRWGERRKRFLLKLEARAEPQPNPEQAYSERG